MGAIFKREFKSSFCTMTAPVFIAYMLLWFGIYTVNNHLSYPYYSAQFEMTVMNAGFISLVAVPLLTMRSFSEEKHCGADKLIYSLPIKATSVVTGKFFAYTLIFAVPTAIICAFPLILSQFGEVYLNTAYSSILGYFLLGCALIAIGMFISSLTESQVIAATLGIGSIILISNIAYLSQKLPDSSAFSFITLLVIAALIGLITFILTKNWFVAGICGVALMAVDIIFFILKRTSFEGLMTKILEPFDLFARLDNFALGILDIKALVFYLSVTVFFLFLTVQAVEKKRWN